MEHTALGTLLGYIRYNSFIVCYPIGAFCEGLCLFNLWRVVSQNDQYSIKMPNKWNFAFYPEYFFFFSPILYVTVFPRLYFYMFRQRAHFIQTMRQGRKGINKLM